MVKPSPVLCARLRFTTKEVGRGFYRGTRTGSMGAHTEYGGYVIDWRKVRHYNMPDLTDFRLTPFVTAEMAPTELSKFDQAARAKAIADRTDGMTYLRAWKDMNVAEYEQVKEFQRTPADEVEERAYQQLSPVAEAEIAEGIASSETTNDQTGMRQSAEELPEGQERVTEASSRNQREWLVSEQVVWKQRRAARKSMKKR